MNKLVLWLSDRRHGDGGGDGGRPVLQGRRRNFSAARPQAISTLDQIHCEHAAPSGLLARSTGDET